MLTEIIGSRRSVSVLMTLSNLESFEIGSWRGVRILKRISLIRPTLVPFDL